MLTFPLPILGAALVAAPGQGPPPPSGPGPDAQVSAPAPQVDPGPGPAPVPGRPRPPRIELQAGIDLLGGGSNWRGDGVGYAGVTVALRFFRAIALYGQARLGYGGVDQRLLTPLSVGLQGGYPIVTGGRSRAWPYARLGFVHQHEEPLPAVAENIGGAILGIGAGIRHRAGLQAGLGCDIVLLSGKRGELVLGPEVGLFYLGYSSGPDLYGFAGLQVGGNVTLF